MAFKRKRDKDDDDGGGDDGDHGDLGTAHCDLSEAPPPTVLPEMPPLPPTPGTRGQLPEMPPLPPLSPLPPLPRAQRATTTWQQYKARSIRNKVAKADMVLSKDAVAIDHSEKRQKRFRTRAPQAYSSILERAQTQRMFVVDRKRFQHSTQDCQVEEVTLAGSTGNIYTCTISHTPSCTCPNHQKTKTLCKHIVYVLVKVLKAPEYMRYQQALLSSELREIFRQAGPLPSQHGVHNKDGQRKPCKGECPICCDDMSIDEQTVWCRAGCGNNLHKECFDNWAASKSKGWHVTCPYCRATWQADCDLKSAVTTGSVGSEGYLNIADQLGISTKRDHSTYHGYWVRAEMRGGRTQHA